mmetsp:Transcript_31565/g.100162  ORF Transcript_31565/g.100162 Transcript_31565/m.100162 type:complete len:200 (-) Transcript_31565:62-661(-)
MAWEGTRKAELIRPRHGGHSHAPPPSPPTLAITRHIHDELKTSPAGLLLEHARRHGRRVAHLRDLVAGEALFPQHLDHDLLLLEYLGLALALEDQRHEHKHAHHGAPPNVGPCHRGHGGAARKLLQPKVLGLFQAAPHAAHDTLEAALLHRHVVVEKARHDGKKSAPARSSLRLLTATHRGTRRGRREGPRAQGLGSRA